MTPTRAWRRTALSSETMADVMPSSYFLLSPVAPFAEGENA